VCCSPDRETSDIGMDLSETYIHSFIVRIWIEETAEEVSRAVWRGHITHIPSGERRYVEDLDAIVVFIAPYLEAIGVKFDLSWRVKRWLKQWELCLTRQD
jgi:hypothetical protein